MEFWSEQICDFKLVDYIIVTPEVYNQYVPSEDRSVVGYEGFESIVRLVGIFRRTNNFNNVKMLLYFCHHDEFKRRYNPDVLKQEPKWKQVLKSIWNWILT